MLGKHLPNIKKKEKAKQRQRIGHYNAPQYKNKPVRQTFGQLE